MNSTAQLDLSEEKPKVLGNPTEGALLLWLRSEGVDYTTLRANAERVQELPFSTERKYMATVVRSACGKTYLYVKGAPEIVALFEKSVKEQKLDDEVILAGSFCSGKCNRVGVTVTVNDEIFTGVTPESFKEFWHDHIVPKLGDGK